MNLNKIIKHFNKNHFYILEMSARKILPSTTCFGLEHNILEHRQEHRYLNKLCLADAIHNFK